MGSNALLGTRPRICLINPYPPAVSPRLVRNADALADAGYDVVVVTTRFSRRILPHDHDLAGHLWALTTVNMADNYPGQVRWQFARLRRKVCLALANRLPLKALVMRACCYAGPELASLAAGQNAALYVAHTHAGLPVAALAARRTNSKLMFDAEDMLAECSDEPILVMQKIEQTFIPQCSLVTTMSRAAALRLQERQHLLREPLVLHNTPSLKERNGVLHPRQRTPRNHLRIYWFGQRIGRHSCADQVLRAMARMQTKAILVLRGTPDPAYMQEIQMLAERLGLKGALEIQPRALPGEMVRLAADNDIALGSQPSDEPFHQLAVGNKVFTGLMAGLAIALTDTVAHRKLNEELEGCALLFTNKDHAALARQLDQLSRVPDKLRQMQCAAWELAEKRFNWECESFSWLAAVKTATQFS